MRFPRLAIEHSAFVWMVVIFLTALGVRSYRDMPRTENPEVTVPGTSIIAVLPGASSMDMETMVANPVEEVLNGLDDIRYIYSDAVGAARWIDPAGYVAVVHIRHEHDAAGADLG